MSRLSIRALIVTLLALLAALGLLLAYVAGELGVDAPSLLLIVFAAIVAGSVALISVKFRAARALIARNQEAVALLNQGKAAEALVIFEECEASARRGLMRQLPPLFASNRAAALLRLGRCPEALALCREVRRHPDVARNLQQHWGLFISVCATVELLQPEPNVEAAQRLIDEDGAKASKTQQPGLFAPRCMLLIRAGQFAEVDALLTERWPEADSVLAARELRLLQLLWAFALHSHGQEEEAQGHLQEAGPRVVEERQVLVKSWPELAAFVADLSDYRRPPA